MVKALHAAGIEVLLDVVYNHSAEGGPLGPTLAFVGSTTPATTASTQPTRRARSTRPAPAGRWTPPTRWSGA